MYVKLSDFCKARVSYQVVVIKESPVERYKTILQIEASIEESAVPTQSMNEQGRKTIHDLGFS